MASSQLVVTMSRPLLLAFLLVVLIITSQFEWKQQLVVDLEATPSVSPNHKQLSKTEVKEKIILSQEKNIQRLHVLVKNLQEELGRCRRNSVSSNGTTSTSLGNLADLESRKILQN